MLGFSTESEYAFGDIGIDPAVWLENTWSEDSWKTYTAPLSSNVSVSWRGAPVYVPPISTEVNFSWADPAIPMYSASWYGAIPYVPPNGLAADASWFNGLAPVVRRRVILWQ